MQGPLLDRGGFNQGQEAHWPQGKGEPEGALRRARLVSKPVGSTASPSSPLLLLGLSLA